MGKSLSNKQTDVANTQYSVSSKERAKMNSISFLTKEKAKMCVYGYVGRKEKSILLQQYVPDSIINLIFKFSYDGYESLKFSKKYQSGCFHLSGNDTIAVHTNYDLQHKYILCDVEPVIVGVHCWRVFVSSPGDRIGCSCVMWAISQVYKYPDRSFECGKQVWGGISTGYAVKNGHFAYCGKWSYNHKSEYEVDMLLNCDSANLKIGIVEDVTFETMEFNALPKNYKFGFVPHFNNYLNNEEIRCVKIPPGMFRKPMEFPFFKVTV